VRRSHLAAIALALLKGACAEAWPPLRTAGKPEAMKGVKAAMPGTIEREDGTTQVTYAGWPLYTFVG
jgi:predicted lipoprotein with Yx(FWY)xxD motif